MYKIILKISEIINLLNRIVPNVSQPSSEYVNNEVVKKKHKKHKKDKKSKKQKQQSLPANTDRIPVAGPTVFELPDSLSSNSMSLFANTIDSSKDQHAVVTNNNAFVNSIGSTSLPSSINPTAPNAKSSLWTSIKSNSVPIEDLTFTGKFTKSDDNFSNVINIDSSSASNSPKYRSQSPGLIPVASRSSSPSRINLLPMRGTGSRIATDEENSSTQHISLLQPTESSMTGAYGESLAQVNTPADQFNSLS